MEPRLQEIYNQLESIYQPQRTALQQQQPLFEQQAAANRAALEQARVNAFRDITQTAGQRGMLFSGFTPEEQARYTGTKYLPALAGVEQTLQQRKLSLEQQLNQLQSQQRQSAQDILSKQMAAEEAARQRDIDRQLKIDLARMAARSRGGGTGRKSTTNKGWGKVKVGQGAGGGFAYQDPTGLPVSAAVWSLMNNVPLEQTLSQDPTKYAQEARGILTGAINPPAPYRRDYQGRMSYVQQKYSALF
jgi:hypothetical protein